MMTRRTPVLWLSAVVLAAGCGGGETSLGDYVEQISAIIDGAEERAAALYASPEGAVLSADGEHLTEFEPGDLQVALDAVGEIEMWVLGQISGIDPPEAVAALHDLFWSSTYTSAREALAARAGQAADWGELSNSPEMAAYRSAVAGDKEVCGEIQAMLDDTEIAEAFAGTPWVPSDLQEVITTALGCDAFPDDPGDLFRPAGS